MKCQPYDAGNVGNVNTCMINKETYCSLATSGWDSRNGKMCCYASLPKYPTFSDMKQDEKVKNLQHDLANGTKNPICNTCWHLEEVGNGSMREQFLHEKDQDQMFQENQTKKLKHLVLDSGVNCNFACRTCGPWSSSGHIREWELRTGNKWENDVNDITKLLQEDLSEVQSIEVLGGEPFINLEHLKILEKIKDNKKLRLLSYTTNGSVKLREDIHKYFNNFQATNICLSIDAIDKPFGYVRTLGKWQVVSENVIALKQLQKIYPGLSISVHITVSVLNVLYLPKLIAWIKQHNFPYDFTFCTHPTEYSLDILNDAQKDLVIESIKDVSGLEPVVSHIESCDYNSKLVQKFWEATEFTKNYRKLDLEEYLPELHTLIK